MSLSHQKNKTSKNTPHKPSTRNQTKKSQTRLSRKMNDYLIMRQIGIPKFGMKNDEYVQHIKQIASTIEEVKLSSPELSTVSDTSDEEQYGFASTPTPPLLETQTSNSTKIDKQQCGTSHDKNTYPKHSKHSISKQMEKEQEQEQEQTQTDIPSKTPNTPKTCILCHHTYPTHDQYERHLYGCEIRYKAVSHNSSDRAEATRNADLPSYHDLVRQVKQLEQMVTRQQKTIHELTTWMSSQRRKISVTDWLAQYAQPSSTFHEWTATIQVLDTDIEYFMEHNYYDTVAYTVCRYLPSSLRVESPLRAFHHRSSYVYVYDTGEALRTLKIPIRAVEDEEEDKRLRWYCIPLKAMRPVLDNVKKLYFRKIHELIQALKNEDLDIDSSSSSYTYTRFDSTQLMNMTKKLTTGFEDPYQRVLRIMNKVFQHAKEDGKLITNV